MEDVKKEEVAKEEEKKDERTPLQKVQDYLKVFDFIKFDGKTFVVSHAELTAVLTPKIFTMGDLSARGRLLAAYNGGVSNIDAETFALNSCLATISVGFENAKFNLEAIKDANLIDALYLAAKSYNTFFRSVPIGITI